MASSSDQTTSWLGNPHEDWNGPALTLVIKQSVIQSSKPPTGDIALHIAYHKGLPESRLPPNRLVHWHFPQKNTYWDIRSIIVKYSININIYNRRKFRSETSDNMDSWKAEVKRVRREKIRRKKMQMREKVGKSRFTVFFQWFVAPEGRKVGSLKRRVRSQLARWDMKNCTPLWREAHFEVKMYKTPQRRTTFFWKLRCRKSARRCGAKHILKSKCTKHTMVGPLLEVAMSKKCTPLWCEAHFEVKMYKNTPVSDHFWKLRCWKSARRCGAKHIFQVKMLKTLGVRTTFGGSDVEKVSKKCMPLWHEAHFEVKSVKNWGVLSLFWREDVEKVDTA